ncbi:MAG: hypothetical protein MUF58_09905, partial [Arcicella sp.]|nr:hypothetical protein [Arcicella sp.]
EVGSGRMGASLGILLKGSGKGTFSVVPNSQSGIVLNGDIRRILKIQRKKSTYIVSRHGQSFLQMAH